ncbi:MAG TPA: hypothetical protein VF398_04510 [bacterium]
MHRKTLILLILLPQLLQASTVALISGDATADGRPLLMKQRDNAENANQEYVYNHDGQYAYVGVTYTDLTNQCWGGYNEVGFCIINSNAHNLDDSVAGPDDDGYIIRQGLMTCQTVADFQGIMDSTNLTGRTRPANYGVIDAFGNGAFFEASDHEYVIYDLNDSTAAPDGYMVRANFAYSGGPYHLGQHRHDRALALLDSAYAGGFLTHHFVVQFVCRDLVNEDTDPYPLPFDGREGLLPYGLLHTHDALNRDITKSGMVIQGIQIGENPLLSVIWAMVGEPIATAALPLWVHAESTPPEFDSPGGAPLNIRAQAVRLYLYQRQYAFDALDTWRLVNDRGAGWQPFLTSVENAAFASGDSALAIWRNTGLPSVGSVADFQNSVAAIAYQQLLAWGPPQSPLLVLTYLPNSQVELSWTQIDLDVFGRPITVSGYTIYASDQPFYNRLTGDSLMTVTGPPIILPTTPIQQFYQVRGQP